MKVYNKVHSIARPLDIEITANAVYVASNITPYEEEIDGRIISGYEYTCTDYTKDEYLVKLAQENVNLKQQILDTQLALTEIYEGGDVL